MTLDELAAAAIAFLLVAGASVSRRWVEHDLDGRFEHLLEVVLHTGRALDVAVGTDGLLHVLTLLGWNGFHTLLAEFLGVLAELVPEITLHADQDVRGGWAVLLDFWNPHVLDVFEGCRVDQGEAEDEDVSLRVGERAELLVVFLTGGIPQLEVDLLLFDHNVCGVVIEHGRDVFTREGVRSVREKEAGLADSTIAHDDTLDMLHVFVWLAV